MGNLRPGEIFGSIQNFGPVAHGPIAMPRPAFPYRAGQFGTHKVLCEPCTPGLSAEIEMG